MLRLLIVGLLLSLCQLPVAQEVSRQSAIGAAQPEPLSVEITTHLGDEQIFRAGDELTFLVNLNRPAYLTIIFQDAAGTLVQLLPNVKTAATRYEPGWYFAIPDARDPFLYRVAPPYGDEYVYAYASDVPLPELTGKQLSSGLRRLQGSAASVDASLTRFAADAGAELSRYRTHMITTP